MFTFYARVSYVDKFGRLKLVPCVGEDRSWPTLIEEMSVLCSQRTQSKELTVKCNKMDPAWVGRDCKVVVKRTRYSFKSKLENNMGEEVSGWTLRLIDCCVL